MRERDYLHNLTFNARKYLKLSLTILYTIQEYKKKKIY